jgi:hypothetical protein
MARVTPQVSQGIATGGPVGRKRSGSANAPTRRRRGARAELLCHVEQILVEPTERAPADRWAIRYLESSRGLGPPPAPASPADQVRISNAQAELVVHVITAVLDGLGLSDEVWEQGSDIAMRELKAASEEGWSPL